MSGAAVTPLTSPEPSTGNISATTGGQAFFEVQRLSVEAEAARAEIATNATAAAAAASIAAGQAAATTFNGATNYAQYAGAISTVNGQSYYRLTGGINATDPASDPTNWAQCSWDIGNAPRFQTPNLTTLRGKKIAVAASAIDLALGDYYTKQLFANTTFTLSNVPATGNICDFKLELTNAGAVTITWWAGLTWHGGAAPPLAASGKCVIGFYTYDGGTTWVGRLLTNPS